MSDPRVAVIGAGFGGLATAIRLQAAGVPTTLFEARDRAGGRAYVYRDAGFTFDAGPTVITAPTCIDELFALAGERTEDSVELMPVTPFYRLRWEDGTVMDYDGDAEAMRRRIHDLEPDDVAGYERFLEHSRRVFEAGYDGLVSTPFLKATDMLKVAPQLARLGAHRTVYDTVARFVKNPKVREALSFHALLVGGNPFETSSIYTLIPHLERKWGVYFPRGGTGALVDALVGLFQRLGGDLRLASPVRSVRVERGGPATHVVETQRGFERFDAVVSNADIHHTYARLYAGEPSAGAMVKSLERKQWSMSLFVIYFGTRRRYPGLAHHTVLFGPRYRELLQEVFHGPRLPDDYSLYLHAPTVSDPSLAPAGGETFYVLAPVPHLGSASFDWEREGAAYAQKILGDLESTLLPDLRKELVTMRTFSPVDFQRELGAFQGSAFSLAPRLTQSAYFRPHNRDPRIPGLYLAGAGTHPGAGVPGVINSGKATAGVVLGDLGKLGWVPRARPTTTRLAS